MLRNAVLIKHRAIVPPSSPCYLIDPAKICGCPRKTGVQPPYLPLNRLRFTIVVVVNTVIELKFKTCFLATARIVVVVRVFGHFPSESETPLRNVPPQVTVTVKAGTWDLLWSGERVASSLILE